MAYSILVVDDEALTLRTISRALRDEGFDVFLATTGEEALEILAREHPDLWSCSTSCCRALTASRSCARSSARTRPPSWS